MNLCINLWNTYSTGIIAIATKLNKTKTYLSLIPFFILLLVGAIVTVFSLNIGWIICSVGLVGIISVFLYVLFAILKTKKISKLNGLEFNNLTQNLQSVIDEIEKCKNTLEEFYNKFELVEDSYSDRMFNLKTMIRKSLEVTELYETKKFQLEEFEKTNKKVLNKKPDEIDTENKNYNILKAKYNELLENISVLEKQIATLNSEITILNESVENLDYYTSQVEVLKEKLNNYKFVLL